MNKNLLKITTILCSLSLLPGIALGTAIKDKDGNVRFLKAKMVYSPKLK